MANGSNSPAGGAVAGGQRIGRIARVATWHNKRVLI